MTVGCPETVRAVLQPEVQAIAVQQIGIEIENEKARGRNGNGKGSFKKVYHGVKKVLSIRGHDPIGEVKDGVEDEEKQRLLDVL